MFLIGDFYQLPPVAGTPIMGNPRSDTVKENASVDNIMPRIWYCEDEAENPNALQLWSEVPGRSTCRVLNFEVNQRSCSDAWLLPSCKITVFYMGCPLYIAVPGFQENINLLAENHIVHCFKIGPRRCVPNWQQNGLQKCS